MDALPAELLETITNHCEHASQKNLRSVCRAFNHVATPNVFEHFYMAMFEDCLIHLHLLAKSQLAKHVKKITFYSDVLPEWDRLSWEEHPDDFTDSELDAGWLEFKALQGEQQRWFQESHRLIFMEDLALLPNVTEASVGVATPFQGSTSLWPVWRRLQPRMLICPDDWMYRANYCRDTTRMALTAQAVLILLEAVGFRSSFAGVKQVTKLKVQYSHTGPLFRFLGSSPHLSVGPQRRTRTILDCFSHVSDLDLRIPQAAQDRQINGTATALEVMDLVKKARNLRRVNFYYKDDESESLLPLAPRSSGPICFIHYEIWPRLEHLNITTDVDYWILLGLFGHLSSTLRSLELRDMMVGNALKLLKGIPEVLRLQHIYIECIWHREYDADDVESYEDICMLPNGTDVDEPYERAMKAYLLGDNESMPEIDSTSTESDS